MTNTIQRATGRWQEILPQLGISLKYLTNKHGPCPLCGGKDRFRFDDKRGEGTYFCNQVSCGPGSGYILAKKFTKWDDKKLFDEIDRIIGAGQPKRVAKHDYEADRRRAAIEKILEEANHQHIIDGYLFSRRIATSSKVLKGHPELRYYNVGDKRLRFFPAVIAPIVDANGVLQSAQRIYLADVKPRKKTMPPVNTISGGAVRLHDATDVLGIAEGVETALAAHELFGVPVWAAISAVGMEAFQPPHDINHLHIFADNDLNARGQLAAYTLCERLFKERPKTKVSVHIPPDDGTDYNDVLRSKRRGILNLG